MKLALEPIWPWPLIILVCLAMLLVVAVGYPRRIRHLSSVWRRVLLGLRLILVLIITLWLLRPVAVYESDDRSDAVVYLLMDSSKSMQTPDAPGGISRREAMLQLYEDAKPYLDELGESVEVRLRDLAEQMVPVETPAAESEGRFTAIGANLETLATQAAQEKIAAILLWGDGKQAATGKQNVDPVQAARLLGRQHRPVYTVSHGSAEVTATTLDVSVSELDVSRDVFIRNTVPIKVRFRALGAEGREVRLRVLVEQRSSLPNGQSGPMKVVPPDQDNITLSLQQPAGQSEDTVVDLQFVPQEAGEIKIAVEAEPLDDEVRRTNNRVEAIIRVRSGGIRVAYFDDLRAEFKWLRRINVNSRIQLDTMWVRRGEFADRNDFKEDWFTPGNYDAFIIGDVPAKLFGPERLAKLHACCEQGAGLMMTGGQDTFGAGGYHKTPLASLLPITMEDSDQHVVDEVAMIPTTTAINNPMLQIAPPDQNSSRWNELPPLTGANVLRRKPGTAAQVLAQSKTQLPLLIGHSTGAARVLAFAGDTTWQWAMHDEWAVEAHQRFWRQAIFWLTKMENDGDSPLWINVEPRDLNPGSMAELTFGLRDADGIPLAGVEYDVNVQDPDGGSESVSPRAIETYAAGDYENTEKPGDYWVNVGAVDAGGGQNYAWTRFLVNARDLELDNPAADPALMRELAHVSGGDFLTAEEMVARLQDWVDNGMPSLAMKRTRRKSLWDNWYSLLLFVILLTAEWMLRKKRGLV